MVCTVTDNAIRKNVLRSFISVCFTAWLTVTSLRMWKKDVRQFYSVLTCRGDHLLCDTHNILLSLCTVQSYIIVQLLHVYCVYCICRRSYTCTLWYPGTGFMAWWSVHCLPGFKETVDMKRSPPPLPPPAITVSPHILRIFWSGLNKSNCKKFTQGGWK